MFQVERIKNETVGAGKPGLKLECYHVNGLAVERRGLTIGFTAVAGGSGGPMLVLALVCGFFSMNSFR